MLRSWTEKMAYSNGELGVGDKEIARGCKEDGIVVGRRYEMQWRQTIVMEGFFFFKKPKISCLHSC